jgi:hypothetical protein
MTIKGDIGESDDEDWLGEDDHHHSNGNYGDNRAPRSEMNRSLSSADLDNIDEDSDERLLEEELKSPSLRRDSDATLAYPGRHNNNNINNNSINNTKKNYNETQKSPRPLRLWPTTSPRKLNVVQKRLPHATSAPSLPPKKHDKSSGWWSLSIRTSTPFVLRY